MRIFLSSVRRGLEVERDALPGLIKALGHQPIRFEDFTAQAVPSRQACIEGVESSDAYLLLLGSEYGHVFAETGRSATHDEWITAQRLGMPRYVFRKSGVTFEAEQAEFAESLGEYGSGRFHRSFEAVADLQIAVAGAVRDLERRPDPLQFQPLLQHLDVHWFGDARSRDAVYWSDRAQLELHVVPLDKPTLSRRVLAGYETSLPGVVRSGGAVGTATGMSLDSDDNAVSVSIPSSEAARWDTPLAGGLAGVRLDREGQVGVAIRLPRDQMGEILDPEDLTEHVSTALRLAGQIVPPGSVAFAIGIGLTTSQNVTEGRVSTVGRHSASGGMNNGPVRVEPDESVGRAAFDRGAREVALSLVEALRKQFRTH